MEKFRLYIKFQRVIKKSVYLITFLFTVYISNLKAQNALSQLEAIAGRRASDVSVPVPSSPYYENNTSRPFFLKTPEQKLAEAADHYDDALKALQRKDWNEAIRLLKKALRKAPDNTLYNDKLKEAKDLLEKERMEHKELQNRINREEELRKIAEEENRKAEEKRMEMIKQEQAAMKAKLAEAEKTIRSMREEIKVVQQQLKYYITVLNNNTTELEQWGQQVDKSYNNVLNNSYDYLAGLFIKYNLMGALKKELQKDVYTKMANLWKSPDPEIQKWLAKNIKAANLSVNKVQEVVEFVLMGGDLAVLLSTDKEEAGYNLKVLLFLNKVMEISGLSSYEKMMENAIGAMPSEYFEQAKMIGETYADLAAICYSWFKIHQTNASNEEIIEKIKILSDGINQRIEEIDCLKKCMKKYTSNCLENCTGKTKWSTPPPPLLFNYRKW